METEIAVALIGASVALILGLLEYSRRQNNRDHATTDGKLDRVLNALDKVDDKITVVDGRVSHHIEYHLEKPKDNQ